jgi:hypothetical protein
MVMKRLRGIVFGTVVLVLFSLEIGLTNRTITINAITEEVATTSATTLPDNQWHQIETWSLGLQATAEHPPLDDPEPEEPDNPYFALSVWIAAGAILTLISDHLRLSKLPKPVQRPLSIGF